MNTENSFNPGDVEPAKVNFIEQPNDQEEHLDGQSTPAGAKDTQAAQPAPNASQQVHAETQDSDERYKNLQAHATKVSQENSELKSRLEQLEMRLNQQSTPQNQFAQPAPSTPAEPDELDTVASEFEELKPIASRMKKLQRELDEQKNSLTSQKEDIRLSAQEAAQERQNNAILAVHPDAYTIAQSVDFNGWLARQPSYMQSWMQTGNAEQVIDLLRNYKLAANQGQSPQQQTPIDEARKAGAPNNSAAPIVNNGNSDKRTWTHAEIEAMSYSEYEALENELDIAAREGRII